MRSILWAVSAAQDGREAARVAAIEVLINVRRFMRAFYYFPGKRERGFVQNWSSTRFFGGGRCGARQSFSFFNNEEVIGGNICNGFELSIGPMNFDQIHFCLLLQAIVETWVVGGKIAAAGMNFIPLDEVAADDFDARANGVAVFPAPDKFDGDPVVVADAVVFQNSGLAIQIVDHHVDEAVVVEISEGEAAACARRHQRGASFGGNFRESTV